MKLISKGWKFVIFIINDGVGCFNRCALDETITLEEKDDVIIRRKPEFVRKQDAIENSSLGEFNTSIYVVSIYDFLSRSLADPQSNYFNKLLLDMTSVRPIY